MCAAHYKPHKKNRKNCNKCKEQKLNYLQIHKKKQQLTSNGDDILVLFTIINLTVLLNKLRQRYCHNKFVRIWSVTGGFQRVHMSRP